MTILNVKSSDKIHKLDLTKIKYAKAEDDGVRVFFEESSLWLDITLKKFQLQSEGAGFLRIYRSTIVNLAFIEWVNHVTLKLKGGTELRIGRTYKPQILEAINKG